LVWSDWWTYSATLVDSDRDEFGVYELADDNKDTLYYGSGKVKSRLMVHLNKKECPMARQYRVEYLASEEASRAREEQLLRDYESSHGKLPMYNQRIG
jgi:predicted GIY-YIG superfamily endonuclease